MIRGTRVAAASVQLPLAEPADMPDPTFGARHRAAVGLSRECDALVVVVSEETGAIRVCERGRLSSPLSPEQLGEDLLRRLRESAREASVRDDHDGPDDQPFIPEDGEPRAEDVALHGPSGEQSLSGAAREAGRA